MRNDKKHFLSAILLSAAMGFMLFIFAPLEIYFNNMNEFGFDFYNLLPVCLFMFGGFFFVNILIGGILFKLNKKIYQVYVCIYLGFFVCTYIQGNFMVGNLPRLDGSPIDWNQYSMQRVSSIVLWVIVGIVVTMAVKKFSLSKIVDAAGAIGGGFCLMLLISLIMLGYTWEGFEDKLSINISADYMMEMSTDQNMIILVLDTVDGETMLNLIEKHPEYKEVMSDFTYYSDVMAAYPYTIYAIPFILSGEWYEKGEEYDEYAGRVYSSAPLFEKLNQESYRMGLYALSVLGYDRSMLSFENIRDGSGEFLSVPDIIKLEMKLVGFKYMPFDIKRFCVVLPSDIADVWVNGDADEGAMFKGRNEEMYSYIQEVPITLSDDKCFRFIHIFGGHAPWYHDINMNEIEEGTYEQSVEACMTIVAAYLQKLKESGVYDNTAIMILSDHGYNVEDDASSEGRQHGILFVKGIGEHYDEMQVSTAPISHADFSDAYIRLIDGKTGEDVFEYKEGDIRERRYLYYGYGNNSQFQECIQTGYAGNEETLIFTGVKYD